MRQELKNDLHLPFTHESGQIIPIRAVHSSSSSVTESDLSGEPIPKVEQDDEFISDEDQRKLVSKAPSNFTVGPTKQLVSKKESVFTVFSKDSAAMSPQQRPSNDLHQISFTKTSQKQLFGFDADSQPANIFAQKSIEPVDTPTEKRAPKIVLRKQPTKSILDRLKTKNTSSDQLVTRQGSLLDRLKQKKEPGSPGSALAAKGNLLNRLKIGARGRDTPPPEENEDKKPMSSIMERMKN